MIGLDNIKNTLCDQVQKILDGVGVEYRLFSRVKTISSLDEKIKRKGVGYYSATSGRKVQDIVGIRIVTYFYEDVDILWEILKSKISFCDSQADTPKENEFAVVRKNMICKMDAQNSQILEECKTECDSLKYVDNTYEIQFRTINSEGWHEIDHLLKYKCKQDWEGLKDASRMFNGVYASLETNDRAIKSLLEDVAYHQFKHHNWESMMRMKFKLRFLDKRLSPAITSLLEKEPDLAKDLYRSDRANTLLQMALHSINIPITFDNIVFVVNRIHINNQELLCLEPENISQDLTALSNVKL